MFVDSQQEFACKAMSKLCRSAAKLVMFPIADGYQKYFWCFIGVIGLTAFYYFLLLFIIKSYTKYRIQHENKQSKKL